MKFTSKKRKILITLIIIATLACWLALSPHQKIRQPKLCIDSHCIEISIADTPEKQEQWLMYVQHLPENSGMLFIFDKADIYTFWMKNTLIPLDMIRINTDNKIVDIQEALPCTTDICQTYPGKWSASYVLEINKWLSKKRNIHTGQDITMDY